MIAEKRVTFIQALLRMLELPQDSCGSIQDYAAGLDHCGRYESVFSALRQDFSPQVSLMRGVLELHDPAEQQRRVHPETILGQAIDAAFFRVMTLPHLTALFGTAATRQAAKPFAVHFAQRVRHILATLPAAANPFLWQMLMGVYPSGHPVDWFMQSSPASLPAITWSNSTMDVALVAAPGSRASAVRCAAKTGHAAWHRLHFGHGYRRPSGAWRGSGQGLLSRKAVSECMVVTRDRPTVGLCCTTHVGGVTGAFRR